MITTTMLLEDGTEIVAVHLMIGEALACIPGFVGGRAIYRRSDDVRAVNCPLCKATEEYKTKRAQLDAILNRRIA